MKKGLTPAFVKQLQEAAEAGQVVLIPTLAEAALLPPPLPAIPLRGRDEASLAVALCLTFELTRSEAQMLAKLMASEYSTYSELHIAANRNNNETTALRSVPVRLCYLRKKLAAYDIGITTLRKLGSIYQGHPDVRFFPALEASTGSLGEGLSIGLGPVSTILR